jgi:A/G-specific adenine glycosylase
MSPETFQTKILAWFDLHGRKDLPWQKTAGPYSVWVSEIMLQQTQVATVIPYFNKFIKRFPDVDTLAAASLDNVLHYWSGLGYYARARNLHNAAQIIVQQGYFPDTLEGLTRLPGIGQSTAGAILSIAFNNSHAILDGNVKRVLTRFMAIPGWPGKSRVSKELWRVSAGYTPKNRAGDYTQAMMDLGATVCVRVKPYCADCPINTACQAKQKNIISELPSKKPAKQLPVKQCFFLLLRQYKKQEILLQQRPPTGIWGGLWSFPEFNNMDNLLSWCAEKKISVAQTSLLPAQRHTFSHFHLDYTPVLAQSDETIDHVKDVNQAFWYKIGKQNSLGVPTPVKKLLNQFSNNEEIYD